MVFARAAPLTLIYINVEDELMKKIPLRAAGGGVFALVLLTLLFAFPFACIEGVRAGLASCTQ